MAPGKALIADVVQPVADAIREFVTRIRSGGAGRRPAAAKLLSRIEPEVAAYLTARIAVNSLATNATLQSMASQIGRALVDHLDMQLFESEAPGLASKVQHLVRAAPTVPAMRRFHLMKIVHDVSRVDVSEQDRNHAGLKLVDLFCQGTGWFDLVSRARGVELVARPALTAWLNQQHDRRALMVPLDMPMVVPPKPWRSPWCGGYRVRQSKLIKARDRSQLAMLTKAACPDVYAAINSIQSTAWRINTALLTVAKAIWNAGGHLGGLPERENRIIPPYPDAARTDPAIDRQWRDLVAPLHRWNETIGPARLKVAQLLWLGEKFAAEDAIWFPHGLDWRGRAYPLASVTGPHPQGADLNRALLEFAEGKRLGEHGADALAIHVANLFGHDKVSLDDRIAWTNANSADLAACAADPTGNRWWTQTDKPWSALAACLAWAGYVAEGVDHVCHLPVAIDATSSGLQHFAALLRDAEGAEAVNLTDGPVPQDVYARVAAKAEAANTAPEWKGRITRKITKRPTMTFVYAATRLGALHQIRQAVYELDEDARRNGRSPYLGNVDTKAAVKAITPVVWQAVGDTVTSAKAGMAWLQQVASLFDAPIRWTTPAGLPVVHRYDRDEAYRLKVCVGPQRREVQIKFATDAATPVVDRRRARSAIAANLIHSLDASHMMLTAKACSGRLALSVVHDSFATHAADMPVLRVALREVFVDQYTPDVLAILRDDLIAQLPAAMAAKVPALPAYGDFQIKAVLKASYIFN